MTTPQDEETPSKPPDPPGSAWIVAALAAYVVLGFMLKAPVLNWVVGPLWLLAVLHVLPRLGRRIAARFKP